MRVVFIGASKFGLRCLRHIHDIDACEIVGVVTSPQEFKISYSPNAVTNVLHADVATFAKSEGIEAIQMLRGMNDPDLMKIVQSWKPDAFLVVGWYHMVPKSWRDMAPAYGMHASLLPDYSGGAPLVWAMINGETRTGITLFRFDDGVDSGPVVGSSSTPILYDDTIATLYERIEDIGLTLLDYYFPRVCKGVTEFSQQDENRRRVFPQRSPNDGRIDWSWPAERVRNFIRAQTSPYPGAFTFLDSNRVTLWDCELSSKTTSLQTAGCFLFIADKVHVKCGDDKGVVISSLKVESRTLYCNWRELFFTCDCFN
ncbi:MAG: methionyl-tRNA formyltransferase [Bacteroidia bacterium]